MFDGILKWIIDFITQMGLLGVFIGSIIEEAIAPIPSPAVMMGAGFVLLKDYDSVSLGLMGNLSLIALVGAIGALIGSYLMYGIGYFGGKPMIDKTKRFTGVSWESVEKFQNKLDKSSRDEITIASLRAIPVVPSVLVAITCGVIRINPVSYSLSFFVGGFVRNVIYLIIGWQLGSAYLQGSEGFESVSDIVLKVIVALVIVVIGYLYWKRSKSEV